MQVSPEKIDHLDTVASLTAERDKLRDHNRCMHNMLLNLPEQFYWLDLEGTVIFCNERQASYFGMTSDEFIGMNVFSLADRLGWGTEAAKQIRQNDLHVMASGQRVVNEENFQFQGETKTFLSYKYPLYDVNNVLIGIFGLSIDITERKKIELALLEQKRNAEEANNAKTNFLMNISHDIRTPFFGVMGNAEILLHRETSDEKKLLLNEILTSSQYLLELLDEIIDVTKLEGKHTIDFHRFDLNQSVEKMVMLMKLEALKKQLTLDVKIAEDVPRYIMSDRKSIERILLNLLGNAIKFTHTGGIQVSIICLHNTEQMNLEISVADTGIGIPADKINTIFDRFRRVTPDNNHSYQGAGLGLWIVNGLVEQLGGKVSVTSQLNKGTRFTVTIPTNGSSA